MVDLRPQVLTIAGFDPSGGAGVLADVKTFEQCEVYGMAAVTALTYQNDSAFEKVEWLKISQIKEQIQVLEKRFQFQFVKIGLIENLDILKQLLLFLTSGNKKLKVIWDPILKASAGFEFHTALNKKVLEDILKAVYLVTPNIPESIALGGFEDAEKNAAYMSRFCNVYLKGGHDETKKGIDFLYTDGKKIEFRPQIKTAFSKHGSGCVLSSAITAGLAKGLDLKTACEEAKKYISLFLAGSSELLGYHSLKVAAHE